MLRSSIISLGALIAMLSSGLLVACDSGGGGGGGGGNEGEGEGSSEGEGEGSGGTSENRVTATVQEEGGQQRTEEKTQAEPSEDFGAVYAATQLTLYFASSSGTVWNFHVNTEEQGIPASLQVGEENAAVWGTLTELAGGVPKIYTTDGTGKLRIDVCPKAQGALLTGRFEGIGFADAAGGPKRTMDGTFKLVVKAGTGALNCIEPAEGEGEGATEGEGEGSGETCSYEVCGDAQAHCCPYMECMSGCIVQCTMANPMKCGADPMACFDCITGCWDSECNVSADCKAAATALNECQDEQGCQGLEEEAEEQCTRQHCCTELKASY